VVKVEAVVEVAELLGSIPLFEGLTEDDLQALAASVTRRTFESGQLIFKQGDAGTEMYVVANGHVNIHLPGPTAGEPVSLKDIGRGEYFGELALFDDKPRSASARATSSAVLFELSRPTLSGYLERRPLAAMAILRTMAERLRETNTLLSERAAKNAVKEVEENLSWSDQMADKVAELNGSWRFIVGLLLLTVGWTIVNSHPILGHPFDEYPFTFFNLLLAILVALQGPLIVMSQNRQTLKDRAQAETDFKVNLKNELNIETILRELSQFRDEANRRLDSLEGRGSQPSSADDGRLQTFVR
jgi:CRP/FNR family cyclic AMP-dependent transcriptional regulator